MCIWQYFHFISFPFLRPCAPRASGLRALGSSIRKTPIEIGCLDIHSTGLRPGPGELRTLRSQGFSWLGHFFYLRINRYD